MRQADPGDWLAVVESGVLDCFVSLEGERLRVASRTQPAAIGELGPFRKAPRTATVVAAGPAAVWVSPA